MKPYELENIRNLCLLSHCGAGKTSLAEAMLFNTGATTRLGKVDDGTTISDYDPDEIKRHISLNLSILPAEWQETKLNLIDTPGYADFIGEVKSAIRVSEGAIIVVCAASGVEVGTEQVWEYSEQAKLARLILVNKMDRENADFYRAVDQLQSKFGTNCVPLQLPIGAQKDFKGIVDLLTMKSYLGNKAEVADIPSSLQESANSFREKLIEAIAETNDTLIEKYLSGEVLSPEELASGLAQAVIEGKVVPILTGSATQNIGVASLMDAVSNYLPSPAKQEVVAYGPDNHEQLITPSQDDFPLALVFKTSADPYVGKLTYFRVYHGVISSNSQLWNTTRGETEHIGQLFMLRGKTQEAVPQVSAGDIGGVAKLSLTSTGDTLCRQAQPLKLTPIEFPIPIFNKAVFPKTKADLDKLGSALSRLADEDPTIRVHRDSDTNETILSGLGETQLDVAADKMQRKFGVGVVLDFPKVPYKETITIPTKSEYKHKKQTGGHGQYGHVMLKLEPLPRGSGHEFVEKIVGGTIPKNYLPAVEKGVNEAIQEGVMAGYPVVDIRATVYDGSFHPVDSSDICFKIAGAQALKKGLTQANPVLLEPIMNIKVVVPEDLTGDIIGDLNAKRARVLGMNPEGKMNVIDAQVPLAEILRYTIDLKSITQGRGNYTATFSHYEETPPNITQKVIAQQQTVKEPAKG
ncbi:MAG: elongation factor G [Dehalococcoidales bacterium]|nr:elongation factor G [Dehalococcoidales bacterium]